MNIKLELENQKYFTQRASVMFDLGFHQEALQKLQSYIELLWSSNNELNLISRKMTFAELIDNHVIDCLLPLKYFPQNIKKCADFGSGGGFPAVIYAIQFPSIEFHLYEKSKLKQDFLTKCQQITNNLKIHGDLPPEFDGVDLVTARGFKPIDVILQMSQGYYKNNGHYFLLKARREKINEEISDAHKKNKLLKCEIIELKSPVLEVERNLVKI